MEIDERSTIRLTSYRRCHSGLPVGGIHELRLIIAFTSEIQRYCAQMPVGCVRNGTILFIYGLYALILGRILLEHEEVLPINHRNKNRLFDSFTDENCWHHLRFRRAELAELFILCYFPAIVVCDNGLSCSGEHAFALMLYRLAYPTRLTEMQDVFGRDYSQLSRIFKWSVDLMYEKHKDKFTGISPGIRNDSTCIIRL